VALERGPNHQKDLHHITTMTTPELKKKKIARDAELAKKAKETAAKAEKVKKTIIRWL